MGKLICEQVILHRTRASYLLPQKQKERYSGDYKKKVILIAGPTGAGKTELSLELANRLNTCEIISTDSMQVYRGMDIGTAKLSPLERSQIPHHLIDIRNINNPFNVVDFYYEANECIKQILARGHIPVFVGGAGFYFRALLYGPPSGPPSVPQVRETLEKELKVKGIDVLFDKLEKLDPEYSATITRGDKNKVIRALEIIALTQKPVSAFSWNQRELSSIYQFCPWFVFRSRESLYARIEKRCERMLEEGLLEEVKSLLQEGLERNPSACQAIGYRQCIAYLQTAQTEEDYKKFVETFKQASRRYVKRQFTWFRKEPLFRWLNMDLCDTNSAANIIAKEYLE